MAWIFNEKNPAHDLLSQGATPLVSSALLRLASGFGMGPGVSTAVWWAGNILRISCMRQISLRGEFVQIGSVVKKYWLRLTGY